MAKSPFRATVGNWRWWIALPTLPVLLLLLLVDLICLGLSMLGDAAFSFRYGRIMRFFSDRIALLNKWVHEHS